MSSRHRHIAGLALAVVVAFAPAPSRAADKASGSEDVVEAAFLAMPVADREAAQDALGWLGLYNGTVDGAFGRRTVDAIVAYQKQQNLTADGVVTADELAALKAATARARAAVGFAVVDDAATGIRIGAPMKLLVKREAGKGRVHLADRAGTVSLDLVALADPKATLESLYKNEIADAPGRKVGYKAYKADAFFVVAGEAGDGKFYERYAEGAKGTPEPGELRGFVFAYPKARAENLDRVALAVANAFEPFPAGPAPKPSPAPSPTPAVPAATAFILAPGVALTALTPAECAQPKIDGEPATYLATAANGLAKLGGDFGKGVEPAAFGGVPAEALALTLGANGKLEVAEAALTPLGGGRVSLVVSAEASARGAPAFDAGGGLVAILAPLTSPPPRVGGVAIAEPHVAYGADSLASFIGAEPADAPGALSAAEIARKYQGRVVAVGCAP